MSADTPVDPELETVLELLAESVIDGVRTHLPGKIVSYDPIKQSASVQCLIKHAHVDEFTKRLVKSLPVIHDAIVMFAGPVNGRWTYPVVPGDLCLVSFCSSSIARWRQTGGEVDPGDDRHHDISDAVVVVGLHDFKHVPTLAPLDAVVLHSILPVKIGGPSASDQVMRKSDAQAFMTFLDVAIGATGGPAQDALNALKTALSTWVAGVDSILRTT